MFLSFLFSSSLFTLIHALVSKYITQLFVFRGNLVWLHCTTVADKVINLSLQRTAVLRLFVSKHHIHVLPSLPSYLHFLFIYCIIYKSLRYNKYQTKRSFYVLRTGLFIITFRIHFFLFLLLKRCQYLPVCSVTHDSLDLLLLFKVEYN